MIIFNLENSRSTSLFTAFLLGWDKTNLNFKK